MYAITGITGQVGSAVAKRLLSAGQPVRAVLRDPGKRRVWVERGCSLAVAEMTDRAALETAFAGADGVFVLLPPNFAPSPGFPETRAILAALDAALRTARPGKVVCLSTVGAQATQPNLLNQLGIMEQVLGALPMPVAFLRAAWFMENASWDVAAARESGAIPSFLQPLDRAIPMVATADVGRVAAELLRQDWTGRRVVELDGPRPVSPNDIAACLAAALGHPVRVQAVPRENREALFRSQGAANPIPRMQMLDGFNAGWLAFEGGAAESVKGETGLETVIRALVDRNA